MAFLDKNRQPSPTELSIFGLLFALFAGVVGALLRWQFGWPRAAVAAWVVGGIVALGYYAVPPLRRPLIRAWVGLTFPLGWLLSHAVLALVYYGVFTPIGLLQRLLGRDAMRRKPEPDAVSFWVERGPPRDAASYFKQS